MTSDSSWPQSLNSGNVRHGFDQRLDVQLLALRIAASTTAVRLQRIARDPQRRQTGVVQ